MEKAKIVSNSSPLIILSKINYLHLLEKLFGEIIIPKAVYNEVIQDSKSKKGSKEILELINSGTIQIKQVKNINLVKSFRRDLDYGEAEVIALALEINAGLVLIDETDARNIADIYHLAKTGFIGILIKAHKKGLISNIQSILDLAINEGFWINRKLYHKLLISVNP